MLLGYIELPHLRPLENAVLLPVWHAAAAAARMFVIHNAC